MPIIEQVAITAATTLANKYLTDKKFRKDVNENLPDFPKIPEIKSVPMPGVPKMPKYPAYVAQMRRLPVVREIPVIGVHDREPEQYIPAPRIETKPETKGTACLPCGKWHFQTASGALEEALRFARQHGVNHPEVMSRLDIAGREIVNAERIDFAPENIANLTDREKKVAIWAAGSLRDMRHDLDNLDKSQSLDDLEKLTVKSGAYSKEYRQRMWNSIPANLQKVIAQADRIKAGEITKEQALAELRAEQDK